MRYGFAQLWLAVAVATASLAVAPGVIPVSYAQSSDPVLIRSGAHDGYGRIVLQWGQQVDYSAEIIGDQLIVRFDRPIIASLNGVIGPVSNYISDAFFDPDGRTIAFVLRDDYEVRAFNVGTNVVLDMLDREPEPTPAPPPAAPAPSPTPPPVAMPSSPAPAPAPASALTPAPVPQASAPIAAPLLDVRIGRHPTFYRLVFDWPNRVDYTLSGPEGQGVIAFDAPARIDADGLSRRLPRGVQLQQGGSDPLNVVIATDPSRPLRHFRSGNSVVVDVMAPGTGAPAPVADDETAAAPTAITPPAAPAVTETAPEPSSTPVDPTTPSEPPVLTGTDAGEEALPADMVGLAEEKPSIGTLLVSVTQTPAQMDLEFPFTSLPAAAIWSRAGFLWVAFDTRADLDLSEVRLDATQIIGVIEQIPSPYGSLLRMTIPEGIGIYTTPGLDGGWTVTLQQGKMQPVERLGPTIELDEQTRARLVVPLDGISGTIPVNDPEVGDSLRVVPTRQPGYGIEFPLNYPEFEVLPSVQGVVVVPVTDRVQVMGRDTGDAVLVTAANGLNISPEGARLLASATGVRSRTGDGNEGRIFDLETWRDGGLDNYVEAMKTLRQATISSGDEHRNKARLEMAHYYMANGLGPEANALIEMMEQDDPLIGQKSEFRALKGAVKFLDGQYDEAARILDDPRLVDIPEIQLWRALTSAARGRPNDGARDLLNSIRILQDYPPELLLRLGPLAAEQALLVNNARAGMDLIEKMLVTTPITPRKIMDIQYLKGVFEQEAGEFEQAVESWDIVADGPNRKARAHAIFDRTELLMRLERLTIDDAIEQFERLRYAWRGDDFEMAVLRRLGELQIENKDYRGGLNTLRQAAIFFPNHPQTAAVTEKMHTTFSALYLGDEINNISAIKAVALYDEFRELTPAGEPGDELIRRLADRMVSVELFDRAEDLLEHQVNFRLAGREKARVGARLGLVYLLDSKPEDAIRALEESDVTDDIGDELATQRRHLKARALLDVFRGEDAIALLEGDFSEEAEHLRIDYYRATQDYLSSAETFQRLVGEDDGRMVADFGDQRSQYVLNWAVNLAMAGRERELNTLKRKYGVVMAQGPYAEAFNLITSSPTQGLIDYRTLTSKIEEVENFKGFLATYRDQLEKTQLSAIN
ncbi:hypothetical protein [Thalassospira sp.]|uniref:hypothetical protein n=1 Tax=Thalassospira sp. TaxID=1912094 RepID=UPI00273393AC|nr:hypothetical protein [Thalassospira sp.]MDP2696680.1 hypothetical protein [Thalassospira sp.]